MNKGLYVISTFSFLFLSQTVYADPYIYHTEKMYDGTVINYCRFDNGKIDFCTSKDADNYNNQITKILIENGKISEEYEMKMQAFYAKEVPLTVEFSKKTDELSSELENINKKASYGLEVDNNKIELLKYKLNIIKYLSGFDSFDVSGNNKTISFTELKQQRLNIEQGLKSGDLTEEEYNLLKTNLKEQENAFRDVFEQGMELTSKPQYRADLWCAGQFDKRNKSKLKPGAAAAKNSKNFIKGVVKDIVSPYGL